MSQGSSIRGVAETTNNAVNATPFRRCTTCTEPIPLKRLLAVPNANQCVPCLTNSGDVQQYKRFDEYTPSGDRVETLFTTNPLIERQIRHMNTAVPGDEDFEAANGTATEIEAKPNPAIYAAVIEDKDLDEMPQPMTADEFEVSELYEYDQVYLGNGINAVLDGQQHFAATA